MDYVMPERVFFVGHFTKDGEAITLSISNRDSNRTQRAIHIFSEELLAERWRDEYQPDKQVREATTVDEARRWTATAISQCDDINYFAVDATTESVEKQKRAYFVPIDRRML